MIGLRSRRIFSIVITLIAIGLAWQAYHWFDYQLGRPDFYSGYTLLATMVLLWLLPLRKRLVVLKLGAVSGWLQLHQYAGVFGLAIFFMHVGWIYGLLEIVLAMTFLFVSGTGLMTWYLNRTIPKKLRVAGKARILEDTPGLRVQLAQRAYAVAMQAAGKAESASLAEHYVARLVQFFQQPRSLAYQFVPTGRLRRSHLESLERLDRYLGPDGRTARQELSRLVQEKDDLDYQEALQRRLRVWKNLHVVLLWFLAIMTGVHVVLAHRFHG